MSMPTSSQLPRLPLRIAPAVLLAGLLAACSAGTERFEDPVFTGSTQNQRAILSQSMTQPSYNDVVAGPAGGSSNSVQSSPLPSTASTSAATTAIGGGGTPSTSMAAAPVSTEAPITVRGWTTAGGSRVTAKGGDTVSSVANRYGVPAAVLADVNRLDRDAVLSPGQAIVIPTYVSGERTATVAQSDRSEPVRSPPAGATAGQSIAGRAPLPEAKPAPVRVAALGAQPVLTAEAPRSKPEEAKAAPAVVREPSAPANNVTPVALAPVDATPQPAALVTTTPTDDASEAKSSATDGERRFRWPVRGRIISDFGVKPGGTRNDGINLAVPEGTEVKAAEDGTVIYAGNELKGYGNLVLVRHADGWVSAYAHNNDLTVKRGDTVRRGDTIARAGASGSVSQPQLHFELRKGNKPVDPLLYLSRS